MRDEDFEVFIEEFGEATQKTNTSDIDQWRSKLPAQLLTYWLQEGWCNYANGLFWTINPDDYEDVVDEWLEGSPLERIDVFHAVARTAFGKLYLCGEKTGRSVTINCLTNAIFAKPQGLKAKTNIELNRSIQAFFGLSKTECDLVDENGILLFDRALKKLGPLTLDEMYGFEPALVAGGQMRLENLRRVKLDQHLTILRQLAAPTMPFSNIDIDSLLNS
jgi:hypothetical protein